MTSLSRLVRRALGWKSAPLFTLKHLDLRARNGNEAWIRGLCHDVYLGNGTSLCRVLGRFKMFVDTSDYSVSSHLLMDGYWEMWLTEAVAQVTRAGMTAVDIGANLGYFSVLMADLVGPSGRVHAFEPNPALADRLAKSAGMNNFAETLIVHEQALSDVDGADGALVVPLQQLGGAFIVPVEENTPKDALRLSLRRFDSYPELLEADLIKIDVEGAEEAVIRGMEGLLSRGRPLTIFLEFVPVRYPDPRAFLDYLLKWGFSLGRVDMARGMLPTTIAEVMSGPLHEDRMLVLRR